MNSFRPFFPFYLLSVVVNMSRSRHVVEDLRGGITWMNQNMLIYPLIQTRSRSRYGGAVVPNYSVYPFCSA